MENKYSFSVFNRYAKNGVCQAINECNPKRLKPIFVCVGSDLVVGDSLGPLIGTRLREKDCGTYVYGTLNAPVTAKEVNYAKKYIRQMHPNSIIIAIDAAVGDSEDVGLMRVVDEGLRPGLGVHKRLEEIGDLSIIGIVASRSAKNYNLFNLTRLNLVYMMAEKIVAGISDYMDNFCIDNANTFESDVDFFLA